MSRNNEERLGASNIDATPPIPAVIAENSLSDRPFSFVSPTEFVELPSKGKHYPEGHSLHNQETVEIRYMTAKDEDILTSSAFLKKGVAIDKLLQNVIVDKKIRVSDFLVGDKNAILIATRISGYGELYGVKITCTTCFDVAEHEFDLSELKTNYCDNLEENKVKFMSNNLFSITLPKMQVDVSFRLLNGHDETDLLKTSQQRKKLKIPESPLTDQFSRMIVSVNGSTQKHHVNELINCMPALDSRYLRNIYAKIAPNVELKQIFECPSCGAVEEVVVPLTTEFFWPKS